MIRYIPAAALALAAPLNAAPPPAEGWTLISEVSDRNHWIRDKDWMAGRPEDTSALVWTWVDLKTSRTASHDLILLEINCPAEAYRFVQMQLRPPRQVDLSWKHRMGVCCTADDHRRHRSRYLHGAASRTGTAGQSEGVLVTVTKPDMIERAVEASEGGAAA